MNSTHKTKAVRVYGCRRLLLIAAFAAASFGSVPGTNAERPMPEATEPETISLGIVSAIHRGDVEERFRGFVDYVAGKLSTGSNVEGKVLVARTPRQLAEFLEQKQVDFYMESAYPTYLINDVHGAGKLLLRRWKGGMAEYQSLIFTKSDSGIDSLEDLRGKVIVFEDPGSTSGYFLPKSFLLRKQFELSRKDRPVKEVSSDKVGYIFALSQNALLDLVFTKKAAAGALSSDDYAALNDEKKADIRILAQTGTLPRHLLSVRKDLSPELTEYLAKILLTMHEDDEGRRILEHTDGTTKFDELPGGESQVRQQLLANFHLQVEE